MYKRSDCRTKPLFSGHNSVDASDSDAWEIMEPSSLAGSIGGLKVQIPIGSIRVLGLEGAAFLQQAAMFSSMNHAEAGWFSLRAEGDAEPGEQDFFLQLGSWKAALGIRRDAQKKIRRALIEAGLIEERRCGVPARLYYRVHHHAYLKLLADCGHEIQLADFSKHEDVIPAACMDDIRNQESTIEHSDGIAHTVEEVGQLPWGFRRLISFFRRVSRWVP